MRMPRGPRLLPFFRLAGHVLAGREVVSVELRPFNNRQLNRDLLAVSRFSHDCLMADFSFYMRLPRLLAETLMK